MNWALKGEKFSDMLVNGRRIGERADLCSPEISLSSQGHQNFPKDPNDPEGDVIPVVPLPGLPGVGDRAFTAPCLSQRTRQTLATVRSVPPSVRRHRAEFSSTRQYPQARTTCVALPSSVRPLSRWRSTSGSW